MGKQRKVEDIAKTVVQHFLKNMKEREPDDLEKEAERLIGYMRAANLEIKLRGR